MKKCIALASKLIASLIVFLTLSPCAQAQTLQFTNLAFGGKDLLIATLASGETIEVELEMRGALNRAFANGEALWGDGTYSLTLHELASASATPSTQQTGKSTRANFSIKAFAGRIALNLPVGVGGQATTLNCGLLATQKKLSLPYPTASSGAINIFLNTAAQLNVRIGSGQVVIAEAYYRFRKVVGGTAGAWSNWLLYESAYEGNAASFTAPSTANNARPNGCGGILPTAAGPLWMAIFADD